MGRLYTRPESVDRAELRGLLAPRIADAVRIILAAYPMRPVRVQGGRVL